MNATEAVEFPERLDAGIALQLPGRREAAGDGWIWVVEGWKLFARAPLMWVISVLIVLVTALALSIVPFLGSFVFQVLQAVIAGGFVVACRSLELGSEFELEHLFTGFTRRFVPLAVVGAIFLVASLGILLVFAVVAGFSVLGAILAGDPESAVATMMASAAVILLGTLLMLALFVPLLAAYWFAPALVMMHDVKPLDAMKESFFACFRNFMPLLVYGVVMFVLLILAMIPFMLGLLVWVPLAITSTYVAYRRIFTRDAPAAAPMA